LKDILEPLKSESLKDVFINRFEQLILSGKLAIHQKLPSERELAMQLGVSRPVVHEGLVDLAYKGLVSIKPRVGTVVNDFRKQGSLALLNSLINYQSGAIDPELLHNTLAIRKLIEVETTRLAARHRTDENLRELAECLVAEEACDSGDAARLAELDFAFHHQIAMSTDNLIYPLLLNTFKRFNITLSTLFFTDARVLPPVLAAHRDLREAIARQNETRAMKVMRRLLDHGERQLTRKIEEH